MSYLLLGASVVACIVWLMFITISAINEGGIVRIAAAFLSWSCMIAGIAYTGSQADEKGPCVQYETQLYYNAATKTMMPANVCVLRGEWIEEGEE